MDVYQRITQKIIDQLKQGTVPWHRPWKVSVPKNFVSRKVYRGVNLLMLGMSEYTCPYWATFRQIKNAGGSVNKGEKATLVVYWNWIPRTSANTVTPDDEDQEESDTRQSKRLRPLLKHYNVFNLQQTRGIDIPEEERDADIVPIDACERIMNKMSDPPEITFDGGARAFYRASTDSVHLPLPSRFESSAEYYSTLYHELIHSTGHQKRLDREGVNEPSRFGSEQYSREELVAEIGAAFLCGVSGIENSTINNSVAYVQGWLRALQEDKKLVVIAAAQAQKAADYVCGNHDSDM